MTIEAQFAAFALAQPDDAPRDLMRLCLYDWLACGKAGSEEAVARIMRSKSLEDGGLAAASLFGGGRVPAQQAALVNGATSHALDYDDTHFAHIGHTSVVVISAALATAEAVGATLDELIDATAVGSEGAIRIGQWLGRNHYQLGFHQTATSGAFGAALAAARLMKLTVPETVTSLGLCASMASGIKAQFGTMAKPLNAGLAAQAGVEAAQLARLGMSATDAGLRRFSDTHSGIRDEEGLAGLGYEWRISSISHKFHACCHGLHAMLEALALLKLTPQEVSRLIITTHPRWMTVCNLELPQTGLEAKFSYKMTAAMLLAGIDTADIQNFSTETVKDPSLIKIAELIEVGADELMSETGSKVLVQLADGSKAHAKYDVSDPLPMAQRARRIRSKVDSLCGGDVSQKLWDAAHDADIRKVVETLA